VPARYAEKFIVAYLFSARCNFYALSRSPRASTCICVCIPTSTIWLAARASLRAARAPAARLRAPTGLRSSRAILLVPVCRYVARQVLKWGSSAFSPTPSFAAWSLPARPVAVGFSPETRVNKHLQSTWYRGIRDQPPLCHMRVVMADCLPRSFYPLRVFGCGLDNPATAVVVTVTKTSPQ